jgi:hypothetical protein
VRMASVVAYRGLRSGQTKRPSASASMTPWPARRSERRACLDGVSKMVNSDACPRPTTRRPRLASSSRPQPTGHCDPAARLLVRGRRAGRVEAVEERLQLAVRQRERPDAACRRATVHPCVRQFTLVCGSSPLCAAVHPCVWQFTLRGAPSRRSAATKPARESPPPGIASPLAARGRVSSTRSAHFGRDSPYTRSRGCEHGSTACG